jgi:lysophospholipase L1-like esterase
MNEPRLVPSLACLAVASFAVACSESPKLPVVPIMGDGGRAGGSGSGGSVGAGGPPSGFHWVTAWATALQTTEPRNLPMPADDKNPTPDNPGFAGNTLRQVIHVTMGASWARLRLTNEYGVAPVTFEKVHVARSMGKGVIDTATDKLLTFSGSVSVTVAAGMFVESDPFDFTLAPLSDLAITVKIGNQSKDVTGHPGSRTTSYLQSDDHVTDAEMPNALRTAHWYFLSRLDVMGDENSAAVVILGDSLTDGRGSTTDGNDRWPDALSRRLQGDLGIPNIAVVNQGIGGNALINGGIGPIGKSRFDHDVIQIAGVKWFIVLEGVNDIGTATSNISGDLINAFKEMISKAHDAKIKAYGATILPFKTNSYDKDDHLAQRATVNDWIRGQGNFDATIDLDAVVRNPDDQDKLLDAYATLPSSVGTDYLHLNPMGYRAMGEAVDPGLFR